MAEPLSHNSSGNSVDNVLHKVVTTQHVWVAVNGAAGRQGQSRSKRWEGSAASPIDGVAVGGVKSLARTCATHKDRWDHEARSIEVNSPRILSVRTDAGRFGRRVQPADPEADMGDSSVQIELDGVLYEWRENDDSNGGTWIRLDSSLSPPSAIVDRLEKLASGKRGTRLASATPSWRRGNRQAAPNAQYLARTPQSVETSVDTILESSAVSSFMDNKKGSERRYLLSKSYSVIGHNPFAHETVCDIFTALGLKMVPSGKDTDIAVCGRDGWTAEELDELIESRIERQLRIYSQEMFVAYLLTGSDPLMARESAINEFRTGHRLLEHVSQGWHNWVNCDVLPSWRQIALWPGYDKRSPLHELGYAVGNNGKPTNDRRQILHRAYKERLPDTGDSVYMAKWGEPNSATRLHKIAENIAAYCRNAKRKHGSYEQAIHDWEQDLEWLRRTYYRGVMKFQWPDTVIM